jgi:hypothetical protein
MKLKADDHRSGAKIVPAYIQDEIKTAISESKALGRATSARSSILNTLRNKHGWSDETALSPDAKISIPARKGDVALCVQTGNMGRFYADLLKLEYLFNEDMIKCAVYVIPVRELAKEWGENIANFERFTNEVKIFSKILHTPLVIFGIPKK